MIKLSQSLKYWGRDNFADILKKELVSLGAENLPLQQAAAPGHFVADSDIDVTILSLYYNKSSIIIKAGIFFSEILWAYCCDEEEPVTTNAYCELEVVINKFSSNTTFDVILS